MSDLAGRLAVVRASIADAANDAGREASDITTIVVTKFHPAALVAELASLGVLDVGENRHQEAQAKAAELAGLGVRWHFVGQLQSKKARQVRAYATAIHSVDRAALVDALRSDEASVDCFVQVNLTDDPARGGVVARWPRVARRARARDSRPQPARPHGGRTPGRTRATGVRARSRALRTRASASHPSATALSIGMSHDFRDAILEGATHLRIGTAITGNRPIAG